MADATMQKMMERFKLKVTKTEADARTSLRGEVFIQPKDGNHDGTCNEDGAKMAYCIIPAFDPEYIKNFCKNSKYIVSEPFIPGLDEVDKVKK